jgi:hypothetical protein
MNELVIGTSAIAEASEQVGDSTDVLNQSLALVVKNQETYDGAFSLGRSIKALIQAVEDTFDPICEDANKVHKTATAARKKHLDPLEIAKSLVARKMTTWNTEQERKREEAERKERERLEKIEEDRRLKEAAKLEEQGLNEAAEEMLEEPIIIAPPSESARVKRYEVEKPKGVSHAQNWTFDIIDVSKLSREYMIPDEVKIRKLVKAVHKDAEKLVGEGAIRAWDKGSTRFA